MNMRMGPAAVALTGALAASAQAQLTLAFDINGIDYAFAETVGGPGFGGTAHTGTLDWSFHTAPDTEITDVRLGSDGPAGLLTPVSLGAGLGDFSGSLAFDGGIVKGGSFTVTLDNAPADTYTATVIADSGSIQSLATGGYTLDGLTFDGAFSDDTFGSVDVSEWFSRQFEPGQLFGSFFKFRFDPPAGGAGNGDIEVFVLVPLPTAAYAGLGMLAGVMGLSYVLRRR